MTHAGDGDFHASQGIQKMIYLTVGRRPWVAFYVGI